MAQNFSFSANAFYIFTSISKNNDSRRIKIGTLIDKIIQI